MEERVFTPGEATQTLPLVRHIVGDILQTGVLIRERAAALGSNAEKDPALVRAMEQLEELFEELEALGCAYRDWNFSLGLVDFPSVIDGKEVLLCWRSDEPELRYYHELDAGYAGRRPIPPEYFTAQAKEGT